MEVASACPVPPPRSGYHPWVKDPLLCLPHSDLDLSSVSRLFFLRFVSATDSNVVSPSMAPDRASKKRLTRSRRTSLHASVISNDRA